MPRADFGIMLRPMNPQSSMAEVLGYNRQCIEAAKEGFTTLWHEDHLQVGQNDHLECLTTLTYLAAQYPSFKIGTLVLSQSYRNPALLAKMAANLQFLTGGRLVLGIGAGWKEDEHRAYGYPFPDARTRLAELEEAVIILRKMWGTQPATFTGKHYSISNAYCEPAPSTPIPILIGGGGEQRTLAIVARHADWWNFNSCPLDVYVHKVAVLKEHCERIGRDFNEIRLTYLSTLSVSEDPSQVKRSPEKHFIAGSAAEVTRELEQFCEVGVTHFMFRIPDLETLEHFMERVVPHFK